MRRKLRKLNAADRRPRLSGQARRLSSTTREKRANVRDVARCLPIRGIIDEQEVTLAELFAVDQLAQVVEGER